MYTIEEIKANLPELEFHPATNRLPMMGTDRFEGLLFDLSQNVMINPIWIVENQILDGRSRYNVLRSLKAEGMLHFEPDIREWPIVNDQFNKVVRSLNLLRNDIDKQQSAVYAACHLVPGLKEEAMQRMHKKVPKELIPEVKGSATYLAALLVGTNERYVKMACKIKDVNKDFLNFVMNRLMTLQEGIEFIGMKIEQRELLFDQMKAGSNFKDAYKTIKLLLCDKKDVAEHQTEQSSEQSDLQPWEKSKDLQNVATNVDSNTFISTNANQDDNSVLISAPQTTTYRLVKKKGETKMTDLENCKIDLGIVFSRAIHEKTLEEIAEVLHRHGYCDLPYKILVTTETKEVQNMMESMLGRLSITAYEVAPQDTVEAIA